MYRFSFFDIFPRLFLELFLWVWFGGIFYVLGSNIFYRYKEKQAYGVMVANPNDLTVSNYIESFKKINGFTAMIFNIILRSRFSADDKMRQAQGYYIVENSPAVSEWVKDQLKVALISNGIQIS